MTTIKHLLNQIRVNFPNGESRMRSVESSIYPEVWECDLGRLDIFVFRKRIQKSLIENLRIKKQIEAVALKLNKRYDALNIVLIVLGLLFIISAFLLVLK